MKQESKGVKSRGQRTNDVRNRRARRKGVKSRGARTNAEGTGE